MTLTDTLFCRFGWYRRKKGGIWYMYRKQVSPDDYDYPFKMWTNEKPDCEILRIEDYSNNSETEKTE